MSNNTASRLGQILISKGLITRQQLDDTIKLQLTTQKRLGELLIEQGLLTEKQLQKALRKQTNVRLTATLIAALLSPFQMASADIGRLQPPTAASATLNRAHGMQPLSDSEMGAVSAQGLEDVLQGLFASSAKGDGLGTLSQLSKLVFPVLQDLEAETSMSDVVYDTSRMTTQINADGSINLRLPSSIGEMRFDNIRVRGADVGQSMGNVVLQNIDLSQASLKVSIHP